MEKIKLNDEGQQWILDSIFAVEEQSFKEKLKECPDWDGIWAYICEEAAKLPRTGNAVAVANETVLNWAIHCIDEKLWIVKTEPKSKSKNEANIESTSCSDTDNVEPNESSKQEPIKKVEKAKEPVKKVTEAKKEILSIFDFGVVDTNESSKEK